MINKNVVALVHYIKSQMHSVIIFDTSVNGCLCFLFVFTFCLYVIVVFLPRLALMFFAVTWYSSFKGGPINPSLTEGKR